jgi:hypothetical protein
MDRARSTPDADAARRATSLSRPSHSPSRCRLTLGARSHGAKVSIKRSVPASPACGLGPRIATTGVRTPMPKNGSSSNGRRTKARRPNTGSRLCGGYGPRNARANRQTALADRARLSGTQTGTRVPSLRRARLARLSPPHGALRRGLRIPGLRTESASPSDDKTLLIEAPSLPSAYRPGGSADPNRTPRHSVNRKPPH